MAGKQKEKEYAKLLYTSGDYSQKEIAERVGVTQKTIGGWIEEGMWEYLKKSLLTSKSEQLSRLYEILNAVTTKITETEGGYGDTKMADMMIKYTAAIKNLETETNAGQKFETGMAFIKFVMRDNIDLGKQITAYFDAFIQAELNHQF